MGPIKPDKRDLRVLAESSKVEVSKIKCSALLLFSTILIVVCYRSALQRRHAPGCGGGGHGGGGGQPGREGGNSPAHH